MLFPEEFLYSFNDFVYLVFRQAGVHRKAEYVPGQVLCVVEGVFRILVEVFPFPCKVLEGSLIAERKRIIYHRRNSPFGQEGLEDIPGAGVLGDFLLPVLNYDGVLMICMGGKV